MGAGAEQEIDCFDAVARHHDLMADVVLAQRTQGQRLVIRIVFDKENHSATRLTAPSSLGSVNENGAPLPSAADAQTRPPWRVMMRWTMASPIPVPGNSLTACRRWKGPNSLPLYFMSKPAPLSRTKKVHPSGD